MIKIEKLDDVEGVLEMHGKMDDLLAETVLIMWTLANRLEAETGTPAEYHIAAMAQVATDNRFTEVFDRTVSKQQAVDLGSIIWKWGSGDEP